MFAVATLLAGLASGWPSRSTVAACLILLVVAVLAAFAIFFFAACLWEKQHLAGDVEPVQQPFPYTPNDYWIKTREEAARLGYWFAGDFATRKTASVVRGLETYFFTADHLTLINIVGASVAGAKTKKTVLRTRLQNGKIIESTDSPVTHDVTRVIESRMLMNAGLEELMNFHRTRLQHAGAVAVPFNPDAALAESERIQIERGQRLVEAGLARWVNPEHTCIRLNVSGALAYLKSLFSQLGQLENQRMRTNVKRVG